MLKIIIMSLVVFSCNRLPCELGKEGFLIAFRTLYTRDILRAPSGQINVIVPSGYEKYISKEMDMYDKKIYVNFEKISAPSLEFTNIKQEDNGFKMSFIVSGLSGGYRYEGTIVLTCEGDKLVYKNIYYFSAID